MIQTKKPDWDKRIQRAIVLVARHPSAAEVLVFYGRILEFQKTLYDGISSPAPSRDAPFRERLSIDTAMRQLPTLLTIVQKYGPSKLAQEAAEISRGASRIRWSQEHKCVKK